MNEELYELLMKLPKRNLINVMWDAVDSMQAYNGKTRQFCIITALGDEPVEDDGDVILYRIPSLKKIKEHTAENSLL